MTPKKVVATGFLISLIAVCGTAQLWTLGITVALVGIAITIAALLGILWAVVTLVQ